MLPKILKSSIVIHAVNTVKKSYLPQTTSADILYD